ncbi:hypothetical protein AAP_05626 [Ascosphaera apis ARSEF 7405]|uniref:Uncharacterized protein n=1 Tax=Ascosphaera apis ARSEF 7405 TaxID=392613 RepID=A0A162I1F1_9EURO|nr:hypothetical protein AAP_05626 [Ascosphaera apis ARSEF 7405]
MIIDPHYDESMTLMVRGMSPSEDSAIRAYTNHKSTCAACFTNDPQRTLWCPTGSACARALASFYIVAGPNHCSIDNSDSEVPRH